MIIEFIFLKVKIYFLIFNNSLILVKKKHTIEKSLEAVIFWIKITQLDSAHVWLQLLILVKKNIPLKNLKAVIFWIKITPQLYSAQVWLQLLILVKKTFH